MEVVKLVDEVGVNNLIEGRTFEDALVLGPAVILPLGGLTMEDSTIDGTPEAIFIVIADKRPITGVIGLVECTFRRCRLQNIAIAGSAEIVENFKKAMGGGRHVFTGGASLAAEPSGEAATPSVRRVTAAKKVAKKKPQPQGTRRQS